MLFPWYIKYPNQNDEILNLDWILSTIDNLVNEVANFVSLNTIKYADPIQWNITTQYEKNTVVIDPITGTAYISTKPVPAGVGLNNTDYWNLIFTLDVISANKNITLRDDANNMLATFESEIGDWLLWQGTLYVVTRDIEIGQAYTEDYNIERATVEYFIKLYINNLKNYVDDLIGDLDNLDTTDKDNLVAAINSLLSALGDITDLTTEDKDSAVDAINELVISIGNLSTLVGDLDDLTTSDKDSIVDAINELVTSIGDLSDLDTTNKDSVVEAINEVVDKVDNIKPNTIFENISAMTSSTTDFAEGEILQTVSPAVANWKVVTSSSADNVFKHTLNNGKIAEYVPSSVVNVAALGATQYSNISDMVTAIIAAGYKKIYVPKGIYYMAATLTSGIEFYGDGIGATTIIVLNHENAFTIDGEYVYLHDLSIQDVSPYNGNGITTSTNGCINCTFRNIHIENCNNGFLGVTSMIWNEFYNCDFVGNMNVGFVITGSTPYFNDNAFYSCKFNNNVNEGCRIDVADLKDFANSFYSCNFEYNSQDRFGKTHTAHQALLNTGFTLLYGCYFEGNGTDGTDAAILNYDKLFVSGCIFVNEKYVIANNTTGGGVTGEATFISCKAYNLATGVSLYPNTKCVCINNTFDVPAGATNISLDDNKLAYQSISNVTVNCDYPLCIDYHNSVTALSNAKNGQIIYIKAMTYNVVIAAALMLNGSAYTISAGTCAAFLVFNDKLTHIV